ncbi:uncharacterized protein A4U43_C08F22440 [Asparagus officinalis]|uniref:U11/U12 small nuclear ribonucleoprotein 48 kDa protein isoform X2 n=1 Tax=Asparagus officinalis TaxID=4686 RepID=UPI00098E86F7|nr:U11/U12 small nuclear ribonucleoprotein 48 kDa protein isoform X2 [Asparagus officinalis]ONK60771.1 uncharacterized protein A4U43_C08F22440 [Asparagus officinalis]
MDSLDAQTTTASSSPNPNPNPPTSDLPSSISLLEDAILAAESTIKSLSSSFSSPSQDSFCVCPHDSRHRLPPESLFRHSLLCSSSPSTPPLLDSLELLKTLRYTKPSPINQNPLCHESGEDLCFSLDDNDDDGDDCFFYKDCPAVVSLHKLPDADSSTQTFLLPAIISAECANFIRDARKEEQRGTELKILPSEFWALRCEVEAWAEDYPAAYSCAVLRVASGLDRLEECGFKRWVISNSPRFGVVIDAAMRDHVFLLFKLCLKVVRREALCSLNSKATNSFECPKLVSSLMWLASQLSILYGVANGRLFAIAMLRESLLNVGFNSMVFKSKDGSVSVTSDDGIDGKGCEYSQPKSSGGLEISKNVEESDGGRVFVSQIAAAVAALHERLLLEERIKELWFARKVPKSQLLNAYLYASTRACEIRENRPNYRAVSEHDGLFWQRGNNQDSGKAKTREELLAEERDYKRRRTSYRGKKVKRNATEVLRDIIEEHMEEIMQAGGIGYDVKDTGELAAFSIDRSPDVINARIHEFQHGRYEASERKLASPGYDRPLLYNNDRSKVINVLQNSRKEQRHDYREHQEGHWRRKHKKEKNYWSENPTIAQKRTDLRDQFTHLGEQGDTRAHDS